jgi:gliding motility-associated lipoprotein GldH
VRRNFPYCFLLLLLPLLLFSSCGETPFFEETVEIPDQTWKHADMIQFKVEVDDTVNTYDFFVNIRHTKSYSYSNLFVFLHTIAPDGRKMTDTLEFPMADPEGNYVGKVSGGLVLNRIIVKKETRFPKSGEYKFILEQAMREKELPEITDVGLSIVKNK